MTETEYIRVRNLSLIKTAKEAVRDVLPGKDWGITATEHERLLRRLTKASDDLFALIDITQ